MTERMDAVNAALDIEVGPGQGHAGGLLEVPRQLLGILVAPVVIIHSSCFLDITICTEY
jgi:hypothetical protein